MKNVERIIIFVEEYALCIHTVSLTKLGQHTRILNIILIKNDAVCRRKIENKTHKLYSFVVNTI